MDKYFFNWDGSVGKVYSHGVVFDFNQKPEFSFKYTIILYETEAGNYFKIYDNAQSHLTDEEIAEIRAYCDAFYDTNDFPVFAYDPEDNNMFKGQMQKSEAVKLGYEFRVLEEPGNLNASWDADREAWKIYRFAIRDDGQLLTDIAVLDCRRCVLFFTDEEWADHSKPEHDYDRWDFVTETWHDTRDIEELRHAVLLEIRSRFEVLRWKALTNYIPQYEQDTWRTQLDEATNWKKDSSYPTPYIDTFLEYRIDDAVPSKEELVDDIIANNTTYVTEMAKINATQWKWIKDAQAATDNATLDYLRKSVESLGA